MNIVSFGGGTNSAAMIIGMYQAGIPVDLITFADTGAEQPHTYNFNAEFGKWLKENGLPEITVVWCCTKDGERLTLEDECLKSHTLPSIAYGFKKCSLKHKVGPQEKYCNNYKPCKDAWKNGEKVNKFIGYDAGESRRVEHSAPRDAADTKYSTHYPLYDWGWTREKCKEVIVSVGLTAPGKSSCFFCPSMKKKEIQELWENNEGLFKRAVDIEENAKETLVTVKGLGRNWSWGDYKIAFEKTAIAKQNQFVFEGFEELTGGCICGAPCGCYDG